MCEDPHPPLCADTSRLNEVCTCAGGDSSSEEPQQCASSEDCDCADTVAALEGEWKSPWCHQGACYTKRYTPDECMSTSGEEGTESVCTCAGGDPGGKSRVCKSGQRCRAGSAGSGGCQAGGGAVCEDPPPVRHPNCATVCANGQGCLQGCSTGDNPCTTFESCNAGAEQSECPSGVPWGVLSTILDSLTELTDAPSTDFV